MEKLDQAFRPGHEGVVNIVFNEHRPHRHHAIGQPLGGGHDVGHHIEILSRERRAQAPEPGDDFVKNQQNAVGVANLAQALQIALGRDQHAGGTSHRLDDDSGNRRGVVQFYHPLQIVGKFSAVFRHPAGKRVALDIMGVANVVGAGKHCAEHFAVGADAAHRDAAEIGAVIAALAPDQPGSGTLTAHPVIGQRHFQGGVDRL